MSAYDQAYEKFLMEGLTEWANAHKDDAIKAFRSIFGKVEEAIMEGTSYYGWQGPVSYQIRWKGEEMAKAEVYAGAAAAILRELAEHADEKDVASEVLRYVTKSLKSAVKEAVTVGNSGFHFEVARAVGRAAYELLEDNWEFNTIIYTATAKAEREVTPDEISSTLTWHRNKLRELTSKKASMRSETRIAKIDEEISHEEEQVALWESHRDIALEAAKQEVVTV